MGYDLNVNSSTLRVEPVGTVRLRNSPDAPEVFEEMGAEVIFGSPRFVSKNQIEVSLNDSGETRLMKAKRFCIATGSSPFVPPIEGIEETGFITNEEVFHL